MTTKQNHHYYAKCPFGWAVGETAAKAICALADSVISTAQAGPYAAVAVRVELPIDANYTISDYFPDQIVDADGRHTGKKVPLNFEQRLNTYIGKCYMDAGYHYRDQYLCAMAYEYGVTEFTVFELANLLGENEDFDGLLSSLEFDYMDDL